MEFFEIDFLFSCHVFLDSEDPSCSFNSLIPLFIMHSLFGSFSTLIFCFLLFYNRLTVYDDKSGVVAEAEADEKH